MPVCSRCGGVEEGGGWPTAAHLAMAWGRGRRPRATQGHWCRRRDSIVLVWCRCGCGRRGRRGRGAAYSHTARSSATPRPKAASHHAGLEPMSPVAEGFAGRPAADRRGRRAAYGLTARSRGGPRAKPVSNPQRESTGGGSRPRRSGADAARAEGVREGGGRHRAARLASARAPRPEAARNPLVIGTGGGICPCRSGGDEGPAVGVEGGRSPTGEEGGRLGASRLAPARRHGRSP